MIQIVDKTYIYEKLISSIKSAICGTTKKRKMIDKKDDVVCVLSDILSLGKEAIYRRLKGTVPFTFEEIVKISITLNLSLDEIIGSGEKGKAIFNFKPIGKTNASDYYLSNLKECIEIYKDANKNETSNLRCAFNSLPYFFYLNYETLSKVKLFRWLYQVEPHRIQPFKDLDIPKEIKEAQRKFIYESRCIKRTSIILSQDMLSSFIREVYYFRNLSLIDQSDIKNIQSELNTLLDELESYTISGIYQSANEILLYLSNIDIDASYILLEQDEYSLSHLELYGIGGINTSDKKVCEEHFKWINYLKRYSSLITHGGEMQRHLFFQEQRLLISTLTHHKKES